MGSSQSVKCLVLFGYWARPSLQPNRFLSWYASRGALARSRYSFCKISKGRLQIQEVSSLKTKCFHSNMELPGCAWTGLQPLSGPQTGPRPHREGREIPPSRPVKPRGVLKELHENTRRASRDPHRAPRRPERPPQSRKSTQDSPK
jgi:hypothetical protein